MIKWALVALWVASITYVYFRGRVRLSFLRTVLDHSAVLAPVNVFMYLFSAVPARPYIPASYMTGMRAIDENWETIRDEALRLYDAQQIRPAEKNDDAAFNSFFKAGWKRFYLKWYEAEHPSAAQLCPRTVAILRDIPQVKAAMFAVLPSGGKLNRHRDPFAGSLRYHLGLSTPNDDRCFIEVDGERYSWRDGQSVVFDETYIHWVENTSGKTRIILFCDLERPMKYAWAARFNRWFSRVFLTLASSPNQDGDQTGVINRIFFLVWKAGQYRRRFKRWNRTVYEITRVVLVIGIIALLIYI